MLKANYCILFGTLCFFGLAFVSSTQDAIHKSVKSGENVQAFAQTTNIKTLSKTTALSFLRNRNHRSKRDISEECREDTCVYEEVQEYIVYKKLDLNVCSWIKRKKCEVCMFNYICKTVTEDCSSLKAYTIKCVDAKLPTVSASLRDIQNDKDEMKQELFFSCTSEEIQSNFQFDFFQFIWLVNDKVSYTSEIVHKTNLSNGYFYERNGIHILGIKVACQYVAFKSVEDNGIISKVSDNFFAGIKVLNEPVTVERGKEGFILLQLTVPFGCFIYYDGDEKTVSPCSLNVELRTQQNVECGGIKTQSLCGTKFQNENWNMVKRVVVRHTNDLNYQVSAMHLVKLFTLPMESHSIWSNVEIPDVKIHVKEKLLKWKGKACYSHSDPHMMTFDGETYDNQNAGTFIMYEGRDGHNNIMQVQTMLTPCNKLAGSGIFCNCGVAIRAASDIYMINRCPDDELFFGFKHCVDDVLDVKKQDDFNYMIYFPTSTYVHLRLWTFQTEDVIEVNIFPSMFDQEISKGLCSKLGSNGQYFDANDERNEISKFIDSWRVTNDKNLFLMKDFDFSKLNPMIISSSPICSCLEVEGPVKYSDTVTCGKQLNCSKPDHPIYNKMCHVKSKRSARLQFTYMPINMKQSHNRRKRSVDTTTVTSTKEEAQAFCENYMKASKAFQACRNVPSLDSSKAIASCILDITLTNSTLWAPASREGFKELCKKELRQNNTFSESKDGKSMIEHINNIMCPNECSGNGVCTNGTCECQNEFGGSDCSQDLSIAPDVFSINPDSSGLCDASDCEDVIVKGNMFLHGDGLLCKMKKFQASISNSRMFYETTYTPAEHNTLTEVSCRLPNPRPKRSTIQEANHFVTGFEVSVSNNAKDYSTSHLVYILDSTCQDTMNVSGQLRFSLKNNYCFINGECVPEDAESGINDCYVCNTKSNVFLWSLNSTKNGCEKFARKNEHQSQIFIISASLCSCLLILIITTVVILRKMKMKGLKINDLPNQPPQYTDAAKPKLCPRKL